MADAPKILGTDTLRQAYPKLNNAIDNANESLNKHKETDLKADNAIMTANEALDKSEQTQTELSQAILAGDSSPLGGQLSVGADGTVHVGPQERLIAEHNSVTTQLAEKALRSDVDLKADQSYVDTQFANIVSGAPKGTYTTLAALQTAYPTGAEGVFLVLADGHWYFWNGTVWEDGGVYQSTAIADNSVSDVKLIDGSVLVKKTTIDLVPKDKRYWSNVPYTFTVGSVSTKGSYGSAASIQGLSYRHDSSLIPVDPNSVLTITNSPSTLYKIAIHEFDIYEKGITDRGYQTGATPIKLTLSSTTNFIRLLCTTLDSSTINIDDLNSIGITVETTVSDNENRNRYDYNSLKINNLIRNVNNKNLVTMTGDFWEKADISTTGTIGTTTVSSMYSAGSGTKSSRLKEDKLIELYGFRKIYFNLPTGYNLDFFFYDKNEKFNGSAYFNGTSTQVSFYAPPDSEFIALRIYKNGGVDHALQEIFDLDLTVSLEPIDNFKYSNEEMSTRIKKLDNKVVKRKFSDKVRYIGHSGTASYAPEDTVEAYKMANLMGMWGAENDLGITSDGHLVLMHDYTVDRTTDGTGNVSDLTLAQIKALNVDLGLKGFTNVKVPTVEEYLDACKQYNLFPVIEVKQDGHTTGMVGALIPILENYNLIDDCMIISFGKATLEYIRSINANIHLGYILQGASVITQSDIDFVKYLENASIDAYGSTDLTAEMIKNCHKEGISVGCWTVDNQALLDYLVSIGVDMITTNSLIDKNRNKKKFTLVTTTSDKGETWTVSSSQFSETATVEKIDNYTVSITFNELIKSALMQFEIPISAQNNTYFSNQDVIPVVFKENTGVIKMQFLKNGTLVSLSALTGDDLKIMVSTEI